MSKGSNPIVTPEFIFVKGSDLRTSIYEQVKYLEAKLGALQEEAANTIITHSSEEIPVAVVAVGLMAALKDGKHLSAHALVVDDFTTRAAQVIREIRELGRFGKHLEVDLMYRLTWDEAERFGL